MRLQLDVIRGKTTEVKTASGATIATHSVENANGAVNAIFGST